jgi:hypothetical protein
MINTSFSIYAKEDQIRRLTHACFISPALIITTPLMSGKALKNRDTYHLLLICYKFQSRPAPQPTITLTLFRISLNTETVGTFEIGKEFQDTTLFGTRKLHLIISSLVLM